ncbi:hypothetical protein B0T16DRAFT_238091 [Cercophora newfieldiana]|uniref:Uncharacterized protein n=1 Tax=Cercophora newfieldiana TaxID=92897 RepID=A0AA39XTM9_9PEZI|nr:hypothetical protein B0T16DRAFT_238091 [Cercophora newfieldiana]
MAEPGGTEQTDAMDTQASPAAEPVAASFEPPPPPPDMPAAFPKKRRGRPPGRPNMTVREADYETNPLVQLWNAAKSDRPMSVVPISIRQALTEDALVHDTQRNIFRQPSREIIYFVQGWITARHIASQRPSYVNGLLIHSRGQDAPLSCAQCTERRDKNALGPFLTCRVLPGSYHNSCSNCKWFDNTSSCSLYTGTKPNRKRKAKEVIAREPQDDGPANDGGQSFVPVEGASESIADQQTPEDGIDPGLQAQVDAAAGTVDLDEQSMSVQFTDMQEVYDSNNMDAQLAAQLLPVIQRGDFSPAGEP